MADAKIRLSVDGSAQVVNDLGRVERSISSLDMVAAKAKQSMAMLGVGLGISEIARLSDEYTKYTVQLKLATHGEAEYASARTTVSKISQAAQSELASTGMLYARISNGTRELGLSQQKVGEITESVMLSLKASGATQEETASATLQLSQAFASGTLRGEEFNAVNEASPRLMKALADGLGVPVGALKQMATEGKITSEVMADTLPKALEDLRKEAAQVQTISGAYTNLKNNVMELVGAQAQQNGTAAILSTTINALADNLNYVSAAATGFTTIKITQKLTEMAAGMVSNIAVSNELAATKVRETAATIAVAQANAQEAASKVTQLAQTQAAIIAAREDAIAKLSVANATIAQSQAQIQAATSAGALSSALRLVQQGELSLAGAMQARSVATAELAVLGRQQVAISAQATAATTAQTAAQTALATATAGAATGAGLLSRAVGFLGGPIGAVTTLLGLGVTAWMAWGGAAKESGDKAGESVEKSTEEVIANVDAQINKLKERNALAAAGLADIAKSESEAAKKLASLRAKMVDAQTGEGAFANLNDVARQDIVHKLGEQYGKLYAKIQAATEEQRKFDASGKVSTDLIEVRERLMGVNKQYLEDLNKLEAAKEKGVISEQEFIRLVSELANQTYEKSKAGKVAAKAAADEGLSYDSLMKTIKEKISVVELDIATDKKLTEGQKLAAKFASDLLTVKNNLSAKQKQEIGQTLELLIAKEKLSAQASEENQFYLDQAKNQTSLREASIKAATDEALRNEELVRTFGMTKSAIEEMELARLEEQLAQKGGIEACTAETLALDALINAKKRNVDAVKKLDTLGKGTDIAQATELLAVMTELDNVAKSAAQGMAASFGKIGGAIGGMTTALSGYSRAQAAIAAQLAASTKDAGGDQSKIYKANAAAADQMAKAQISSYANMASAAKGFFKENSTGYKVMETAEKGFRAVEMAMAIETMLEKSGLVTAFTGLFVTSKATETGVILATESTMTAATVTGEAARNTAKVPGVFMSFMSMLGPWGAAAAAVAIAAVMGGAFSGGGGASVDMSAAAVQKKQGTGTVFGDSDAKSDSIAKSLELLESNSDLMLPATMQMAASLRNIESSMGGLTNIIVRTPGITDASNMSIATGTKTNGLTWGSDSFMVKLNSAISGFLFGSTKSAITDGGLQIGGSVDSLQRGQGINQYANINTVKKGALGGLFGGNSNTNTTQTQAASSEISQQFGLIFTSLQSTLSAAATALGGNGKEVGEAVKSFVIDTTKISLLGLKGADRQNAINAVISGAMDNVAQAVFPELEKFRQVGEGYTQTVTRIAVNYSSVDSILQSIGTSFGAVGISSVAARERLIELAGGVDKLAQQTAAFGQTYLTEAEQMAPVAKRVTEAMSALGLSSVTTREQFKEAVLSLTNSGALATEAGAKTYAGLMNVAEAFAKVHPEIAKTANAAKSAADALSERNELQNQFDQLTMTSAQLLQKQRDALDASNQALFDQVQAAKAANAAQEEQAATAKAVQDAQVAATKTAQDAQAAAAKAAADALASTNAGYQQQIDALVKASLPLAEQRAIETRGMADSTLALYNRLELLKAEAKATVDAAAAHQTMLATLKTSANSSLTVLGKSVATEKMGAKTALDAQIAIINAQKSAAAASFQWSKMAGEASLESATKANQKIAALAGSLNSTLESMRLSATQESDRMSAQAQISQALLRAKTTGMLPDVDVLSDALKTVSQPNQNLFSSYTDFARDFYVTAGQIADLNAITGDALSKSDAMVEMAKAQLASTEQAAAASAASFDEQIKKAQEEYELQISQFDQVMTNAQAQLEVALGTNVAILSMAEALRGFQSSLGAMVAGGATHPATGTVVGSALGAVGKSNAVMSTESVASLNGFKAQLKANSNYSAAIDAAGGYQFAYDAWINGSHAKGLDSVPFDGYVAELHQGEMVLPAHVAQSVRGVPAGGGNSDLTRELLEEMRQMKSEIILLKQAAIKTSDNTKQAADILDSVTEGGSVMRTEEV